MHETLIRVRFSETDPLGIVYYSNYFVYFDLARLEMLRHLGISFNYLKSLGLHFRAVEAYCKYLAPAKFDDLLKVKVWIAQLGRSSLKYGHIIEQASNGELIARGHVVDVLVNSFGRPVNIPKELRDKLQAHLNPRAK